MARVNARALIVARQKKKTRAVPRDERLCPALSTLSKNIIMFRDAGAIDKSRLGNNDLVRW